MGDNLNERHLKWRLTSMEDDLNRRLHQSKSTYMEEHVNGSRPKWKPYRIDISLPS